MAEPQDLLTHKRKALPDTAPDDAAGKRIKLDDEDPYAAADNGVDSEPNESHNGITRTGKEEQDEPHTQESPKRTYPPEPEHERQAPEARRPSATGGPPIRRKFSLEEKKRGQRLFGGLVSTLSRTTSGTQQQRRLEIERRQHEKAQQRRAEDEKRRAERLERLRRTRQIEQLKLDEQAMKTRHSATVARAHSLQTRSEPMLCYLPWKLTRAQDELISNQIRTAEETIYRETREYKARKEQRLKELGVATPPRSPSPPPSPREETEQPESEPRPKSRSEEATAGEPKPPPQDANPDAAAATPPKVRTVHHDKDHDENGDEMMQDEEDVVIY